MNRIDRLFAITLRLQDKVRLRAKDLAAGLEVSERTNYRDKGFACKLPSSAHDPIPGDHGQPTRLGTVNNFAAAAAGCS